MNNTARHVFWLFVTARNLRRVPPNIAWTCYSQTLSLPYSANAYSQGSRFALTSISSNTENDVVSKYLSTAETSKDIFEIVKTYKSLLKQHHCIQALTTLDNIYRCKNIKDFSIKENNEFIQLCEVLVRDIKSLEPNEAVNILRLMNHLKIPSTSIITQSLLQLIKTSMLNLDIQGLLKLHYQLKIMKNIPLVNALKIAVPIACQIQLDKGMLDTSSIRELTDVIWASCKVFKNEKFLQTAINALCQLRLNVHYGYAKRILKYLCDTENLPPGYKEVVLNMQQILTSNISKLSSYDIGICLGKIMKKVKEGDQSFYNEEFVDACAMTVVARDLGFEEGVRTLKRLYLLDHTQIQLNDYLAAKCFEDRQVLTKSDMAIIAYLVQGLAYADYKPIFWETMQETISKRITANVYNWKSVLVDVGTSMAVLDCFVPELIKTVFSKPLYFDLVASQRPRTLRNLLLLYQSVKLFCPTYTEPWPSENIPENLVIANEPSDRESSLLPALKKVMGGPQYVLSDLKSKLGHHIDHIVVMRKGGYPIAMNSLAEVSKGEPVRYIEDLQLPAESQVIIVVDMPAKAYSINSHRLKGDWALQLRTLEAQTTHTVIPISSTMWNALMDHEKIPYLMQAIRLKCDNMLASANV